MRFVEQVRERAGIERTVRIEVALLERKVRNENTVNEY